MKKFLLAVLLVVSIFLVGCNKNTDSNGGKIPEQSENSDVLDGSDGGETLPDDEVVKYKITYQWDEYDTMHNGIELFPEKMTEGLNFPKEYVEGQTLVLPKLNMWKKNSKLTYEFEGWYYDAELKNKVADEVLPATITGDITLYAKVAAYVN
jgi:uncharacterized repeat protein (TIGR02543 family)